MTGVFHLSLYVLVAIAAMMLSMAEEAAFPTGLTVPAALLALYLNEKRRTIRLRTLTANVLGVVAFALAGGELLYSQVEESGFAEERRVLAGAHLLSYLTWIALFQAKQGRQYWWLLALSVMHVAVGSILTQDGAFGALIMVYVFLALWTLSVFSLYQASYGFEQADTDSNDIALQGTTVARRRDRHVESSSQLAHHRSDEFQGAIQLDSDEHWVNSRFVLGVLSTSLMSLGVGMVFFVLIPRVWVGRQHEFEDEFDAPFRSYTGFTNEVQLGELGQILESNRPVMQVRCSQAHTGEEILVEQAGRMLGFSEPLFRGSVMGRYENGRWHVLEEIRPQHRCCPRVTNETGFSKRIILHDSSTRTLFGMHPIVGAFIDTGLIRPRIDVATMILMRDDEEQAWLRDVVTLSTNCLRLSDVGDAVLLFEYRDVKAMQIRREVLLKYLELPPGLSRLRQLAADIDSQVNRFEQSDDPIDLRVAHRIEDYLGHNPDFSYSLKAEIVDGSIDPVEDFLFNRKSGHCEYYASAMALLLRGAGIPSRLVSGFKGGEQSTYTGAFVVEERHAHAWVEALINGRWRTFDPTPAAREDSVRDVGNDRSLLSTARTAFTALWQQRIVRLSIEEQQQQIYSPLSDVLKHMAQNVSNLFGGDSRRISEILSDPRRWFSIPMFVGTAVVLALSFGMRKLWRRLFPESRSLRDWLAVLRRLFSRLLAPDEAAVRIEFYERFTRLLAREGLIRASSQTPGEFAEEASRRLAERLAAAELEAIPDNVAALFYRVRFGQTLLSSDETTRLKSLLGRLEAALADRRKQTTPQTESH